MAERSYVASHFKIVCKCGNHVSVRTNERLHTEPCWKCSRTIKVVMGYGKNNYRCSIINQDGKEETVKPIHVDQG